MLLIKNGKIVLEGEVLVGDLLVEQGTIKKIAPSITVEADEVIDAEGCIVFPGFIDPHVHMQMTNALATTADSYATGSKAALYGGNTSIINFATAAPGMSLHEVIATEKTKADPECSCNYLFHVEMIDVNEGTLKEIAELAEEGVRSCKIYMAYGFRISDDDVYRTVQACDRAHMLVEAHCENGDVLDAIVERLAQENKTAICHKIEAHPAEVEADAISTLGYVGKLLDANIHVVHLSSKQGLEEVRKLRSLGAKVTVETCPQYLYLDEEVYRNPDHLQAAKYICAPIPRRAEDRAAITQALLNGEIQTLATDHCAYKLIGQKDVSLDDFRKVPGGLPGVEERATLCYTKLVAENGMSLNDFSDLMSTNTAKLYDLYPVKGVICEGADADITIYDPSVEQTISADNIHSAAENTVYEGQRVVGRIRDVVLGGEHVLRDGELVITGKGRYLADVPAKRKPVAERL